MKNSRCTNADTALEYLPAIKACSDIELKCVYSRSERTVKDFLSDNSGATAELYYDNPPTEGKGLKDLLARDDIQGVIVALPIQTQPAIIRQAIEAGKHVLSEKPVAEDVKTATQLIEWYESLKSSRPVWGVAENYRFVEPFLKAAEVIKELKAAGGYVVTFRIESFGAMGKNVNYFHTEW